MTKTTLRLFLLRVIRRLLRLRSSPLIINAGPVLIIAPHPDDESLGCGGLIQLCRRGGHRVHCLFLTHGEASHPNHPVLTPTELGRRRVSEAYVATAALGLNPHDLTFLSLPDGQLPHLNERTRAEAITTLCAELQRIHPSVVLTTYRGDGSSEHAAAFPLVHAAWRRTAPSSRLLEYLVWSAFSPRLLARTLLTTAPVFLARFPGLGSAKHAAIAAYSSQFQPISPWPHAVQPPAFAAAFSAEEEFFIESLP